MKKLVSYISRNLLGHPDRVEINEIEGDQVSVIELKVAPEDLGKVIGRQGRTAKAFRTVVNTAAQRAGKHVVLEIIEN